MIPFEAAESIYIIGFGLIFCALIMVAFYLYCDYDKFGFHNIFLIGAIAFFLLALLFLVPYMMGSISSQNITICNHQLDEHGWMFIMDGNNNVYSTDDMSIKLRIKDGMKTKVVVITPVGFGSIIYKSDLPTICGNASCGGVPT